MAEPQLLRERCSTCILRAGDPMHLGADRIREVIEANRATGSLLTCHKTLPYGDHPEVGEAMCRGYFDAYADESRTAQVMTRMFGPDWYIEIPPPGDRPLEDQ